MVRKALLKIFFTCLTLLIYAGGQDEGTISDKPRKITAICDIILTEQNGQARWVEEYNRITGLELNLINPPHNHYSEQLMVVFASGQLPDICEIQTNDYTILAASNVLVPLNEYIEKSENIKSIDPQFYKVYQLRDGNIYGFPLNRGGGCVTYIRKDWLDNLGLKKPTTWDEFYNVMAAFTSRDPDGNGIDDTIGYTTVLNNEFDYYNRMIMLDARFDFCKKGGKWVDGFSQPEMRPALERFRRCYQQGYIDQEFFTNMTSTARSKMYAGQVGILEYWSGIWNRRIEESTRTSDSPRAEVVAIPPIYGARYFNRVATCFGITVKAQDPELVFNKFIDLMHDKGEGQILFTYGVKGLHYVLENGVYKMLPEPANTERTFDKAYVHPELTLNDWELLMELDQRTIESREIHSAFSDQLPLPLGGDYFLKYSADILALKQEIFAKIIIGEYGTDQGLSIYSEKVKALHIDEIIKELNNE